MGVSKYDEKTKWLLHEFRRLHSKWPERHITYTAARVDRGKYKCAHCGGIFGPKFIDLDHIQPVISVADGFVDWNTYIARLFVDKHSYQVLCKECHKKKSISENAERW